MIDLLLNYLNLNQLLPNQLLSGLGIRLFLGALSGFLIWMLLGKFFIKKLYEWKIGQKIRIEECPLLGQLHEKKKETPTMGGALILFSVTLSGLLWMNLESGFTWILLFGLLSLGALGAYDDFLKLKWKSTAGLGARKKLLVQVSVAAAISLCLFFPEVLSSCGLSLPGSSNYFEIYFPLFQYPLTFAQNPVSRLLLTGFYTFVITGSSNSVNLTDGLDGLAAGAISLCAFSLMVAALISSFSDVSCYFSAPYLVESSDVAIFLAIVIGSLVGFLWYNCHPAQIFMGDTGSLGLGGALAIAAILIRRELFFALASLLFVIEALSVILQVWSVRRYKKRIFLCSPIHHHFEYKGWAETKVVVRFWILAMLFSALALLTLKTPVG